jgi:hypothetical protein
MTNLGGEPMCMYKRNRGRETPEEINDCRVNAVPFPPDNDARCVYIYAILALGL